MKNKKQNRLLFLLILILGITVGFALLSTTLFINGTASIKSNTWNIHWDDTSINVDSGSVSADDPVVSTSTTSKDTVSFDVELEMPGDYFEFEIDAVNEGTVDGALDLVENWITYTIGGEEDDLPGYMDFSVTYDDDSIPQSGDILEKRVDENTPGRRTYKIRVEFKSDIEELPSNPQPVNITVELPYVQHKENCPAPVSFSADSWETIACNVRKGNTSAYNVGDTKIVPITMDYDNDGVEEEKSFRVRLVNKSTPSSCGGDNFGETACGFVVDFIDKIVEYQMYDQTAYAGGGFIDGDLYKDLLKTNSAKSLYQKFPSDLKKSIKDTKVLTGNYPTGELEVSENEKIYLLSYVEVYGTTGETSYRNLNYDYAINSSRQLDYYEQNDVNTDIGKFELAQKTAVGDSSGFDWWLRSINYSNSSNYNNKFVYVNYSGMWNSGASTFKLGVAPAFRIG